MPDDVQYERLLQKARRLAKRQGYTLKKSRRAISIHNCGDLMLIDLSANCAVLGWRFDATPEDVIEYFEDE
jgi:hypothetical protein